MGQAIECTRPYATARLGRWVTLLSVLLGMAPAMLLVDVHSAVAAPQPTVALSPTSGPPGTQVTVTGQNWPAGHKIDIAFPDRGFWGPGGTTSTSDGSFKFSFTWPSDASPGDHQVAIIDNTGPVNVPYLTFTVTSGPPVKSNPDPQAQNPTFNTLAPSPGGPSTELPTPPRWVTSPNAAECLVSLGAIELAPILSDLQTVSTLQPELAKTSGLWDPEYWLIQLRSFGNSLTLPACRAWNDELKAGR